MKKWKIIFSIIVASGLALFSSWHYAFATDSYMAAAHSGAYPSYPQINYGSDAQSQLLKRGEYLVKLGDCIACHTSRDHTQPFAGGLDIDTPFGKLFTPNITPDKTSGIGNWSLAQFSKAMREGISPQGHYYYPAFPYTYFNQLNDDDIKAIKAYLDAIPAINKENKKNQLMFPFNWRFLQLGWRILFFHKDGPYKDNPKKSATWNRGAYIVLGLGHCDMCHTPMHYFISKDWVLGAPVWKYHLTGAMVQGFYAPNITSTTLKNTPLQEFSDVFLKDRLIGGGAVQGPMAEADHDSLKFLAPEDIKSLDLYLSSVVSEIPPRPKVGKGLAAGKKTFDEYCAGCHLTGAGGAPILGDQSQWTPRLKKGLNALYKNAINGIGGMPAKGTCSSCTTQEIQDAVQYIVSQSKPGVAGVLNPNSPPMPKPFTLDDGKKLYEQYCVACHNGSYKGAPVLGDKNTWKPLLENVGVEKLILHTIHGYNNMPAKGSCSTCSDAQLKAAVIYMLQNSSDNDYRLWLNP